MCVADFCAFVGGYLPSVREMRLVRRSDESSVCLVLLRFKDRPTADLFYIDFNNRAVCNHRFHNECLQRWGDTKCPDLWICLICGHIGCGRYHSKHAVAHWRETQHCYALDLETQRVWDYASDGYVHRLVQSKSDGKLVEVPSPGPSSGE
eukprot:jgi/Astpho2/2835/Aster-00995